MCVCFIGLGFFFGFFPLWPRFNIDTFILRPLVVGIILGFTLNILFFICVYRLIHFFSMSSFFLIFLVVLGLGGFFHSGGAEDLQTGIPGATWANHGCLKHANAFALLNGS